MTAVGQVLAGARRAAAALVVPGTDPVRQPATDEHLRNIVRHPRPAGASRRSSTVMYSIHEQLARQTWHEASTRAQQARLVRALRAERRARRADRSAARLRSAADAAAERLGSAGRVM